MTLENLVTRSGLECESDTAIAHIGTYFFFGVFCSFMVWIKCTDMWARKPIIILGSVLQVSAFSGILFYPHSLGMIDLYYFVIGLGTVITMCTSYNLLIEYTPRTSKIMVGTIFLSIQLVPQGALSVYLGMF